MVEDLSAFQNNNMVEIQNMESQNLPPISVSLTDSADSKFELYKDVKETSFEVIPKDIQSKLISATLKDEEIEFSEQIHSQPLSKAYKKKSISKSEGELLEDFQGISRPPSLLEFDEQQGSSLSSSNKRSSVMRSSGSVLAAFDEAEEQSLNGEKQSNTQSEKKKHYGKKARRHTGELLMVKSKLSMIEFDDADDDYQDEDDDAVYEEQPEASLEAETGLKDNVEKVESAMNEVFTTTEKLPPGPEEDKEIFSFAQIAKGSRLRKRSESLCSVDADVSSEGHLQTEIKASQNTGQIVANELDHDKEVGMKQDMVEEKQAVDCAISMDTATSLAPANLSERENLAIEVTTGILSNDKSLIVVDEIQTIRTPESSNKLQTVESGHVLEDTEGVLVTNEEDKSQDKALIGCMSNQIVSPTPQCIETVDNTTVTAVKDENEHILNRTLPIPTQPVLTPEEISNLKKQKKVTAVKNVSQQLQGEFAIATEHAKTIKSYVDESNASAESLLAEIKSSKRDVEVKTEKKKKKKRKPEETSEIFTPVSQQSTTVELTPSAIPAISPISKTIGTEMIDPWKDGPIVLDKKHLQLLGLSGNAWEAMQGLPSQVGNEGVRYLDLETTFICFNCGLDAVARKAKLMKCKRCMIASYCGKNCQKSNWLQHKKVCKCIGVRREKGENEPLKIIL